MDDSISYTELLTEYSALKNRYDLLKQQLQTWKTTIEINLIPNDVGKVNLEVVSKNNGRGLVTLYKQGDLEYFSDNISQLINNIAVDIADSLLIRTISETIEKDVKTAMSAVKKINSESSSL